MTKRRKQLKLDADLVWEAKEEDNGIYVNETIRPASMDALLHLVEDELTPDEWFAELAEAIERQPDSPEKAKAASELRGLRRIAAMLDHALLVAIFDAGRAFERMLVMRHAPDALAGKQRRAKTREIGKGNKKLSEQQIATYRQRWPSVLRNAGGAVESASKEIRIQIEQETGQSVARTFVREHIMSQ